MSFSFSRWVRQPTTIHGLGVVAAGVGVALTHFATGNPTYDTIIGVGAYVLVHLGIDDHSADEQAITVAATDAVNALQGKQMAAVKVMGDAMAAAAAAKDATQPPPAA